MKRLLFLFIVALSVFVKAGMSQINISGMVKDTSTGAPIGGAMVSISQNKYQDTTDTNGIFQLQSVIGIKLTPHRVGDLVPVKVGIGNRLEFQSSKAQRVHAVVVDILGKTVATVCEGIVAPGKYSVQPPFLPAGYYLYVVKMSDSRYSVPFVVTGRTYVKAGLSAGTVTSLITEAGARPSEAKSMSGYGNRVIVDTIIVSAVGYYQKLVEVTENIITGLEIKCRKYADSVIDINGNVYHAITIGTQTWMVENLKTTKYNDGTAIPLTEDVTAWSNLVTPGYCWYKNDSVTYKDTYGALYNWYAVNTSKLAPAGWHVATDTEWITLTMYLGGVDVAGGKLKEAGLAHWAIPNNSATNETGFSALPGGYRLDDGTYYYIASYGYWWATTEYNALCSWYRLMFYGNADVHPSWYSKKGGFSVRCVRD